QFVVSNLFGPSLVDMAAGATSIVSFLTWARFSKCGRDAAKNIPVIPPNSGAGNTVAISTYRGPNPWIPWLILCGFLLVWGTPAVKKELDKLPVLKWEVPALHQKVVRSFPVAVASPGQAVLPEAAEFKLNWLSATGTGIFIAALAAGLVLRFSLLEMARMYWQTIWRVRVSLFTIALMLALGNVTKYSGTDATLGLALAGTGFLYPFFGTLLGWLGVALTGSDTASNVLFGSLQQVTANRLGISPYLMCSANSTGGVMGKMIDAQSIVVAGTAMNCKGLEGKILRYVFWHSVAMVVGLGIWILLLARLPLLQKWVLH
ncbi:MAG TPA: L-lactate permease, partial [Candidatus Limnocylindria bacterium]|nr:L-lactate permease [Candidatus Limnocylindria bacterium]